MQSYGPAESRSEEKNMLQQRLFNIDEDLKNRPFIDTGASNPINTCKFTKNHSYINSGASIPISIYKFTMFDCSMNVIFEASKELKIAVHTILEMINYLRLMLNHQVC